MPDLPKVEEKLRTIVGEKFVSSELCDRLVYSKDYSIEGIADDYTPDIIVKPVLSVYEIFEMEQRV